VAQLRESLLRLPETAAGRDIVAKIGIPGFAPADHATYQPVSNFITRFSAQVRLPEAEK
jgi:hypothetical protein